MLLLIGSSWAGDFEKGIEAYNAEHYKESLRLWESAANEGNAEAQSFLGLLYMEGKGVQ